MPLGEYKENELAKVRQILAHWRMCEGCTGKSSICDNLTGEVSVTHLYPLYFIFSLYRRYFYVSFYSLHFLHPFYPFDSLYSLKPLHHYFLCYRYRFHSVYSIGTFTPLSCFSSLPYSTPFTLLYSIIPFCCLYSSYYSEFF